MIHRKNDMIIIKADGTHGSFTQDLSGHISCYLCGKDAPVLIDTDCSDPDSFEVCICFECIDQMYGMIHK